MSAVEYWENSRVYNVGKASWMYQSVQAAVDAINAGQAPSVRDRALIQVWPGFWQHTVPVTIPAWTGLKGASKGLTHFQNDLTNLFISGGTGIYYEDFLIEGSPNQDVYAFNLNDNSAQHIRRVDMLNNGGAARQLFLTQVGANWKVLFMEDVIVDFRRTSGYAAILQNSSGVARFFDTIINNVFFDAWDLTNYGGSFLMRGVQDVRIRNSTIRGAATWNTGVRLEKYGVTGTPEIDIRHSFLEGGVSYFNEAGTHIRVRNTDARGAISAGTSDTRNSYTGV